MKSNRGFTLIELIVVITILGILAAVALPRFVSIERDARIAKLQAARGAIAAGSAIVHSAALARGGVADVAACPGVVPAVTANNTTQICTEHGIVTIANRYPVAFATPAAASAGIIAAAGLTGVFSPTVAELTAEGYSVTGSSATVQVIQISSAPTPGTCQFTYTPPTALGAAAVLSAAAIAGC